MNQTKKRLTIINLAISITDIETIQIQTLKLALLKSDTKIEEILTVLNEQNYAQAQKLIATYIETPNETVVQRTTSENTQKSQEKDKKAEEQAIIEEFDLFTSQPEASPKEVQQGVNYDAFLEVVPQVEEQPEKSADYTSLLNVDANDVLPDNIDLDLHSETTVETTPMEDITINQETIKMPSEQEDTVLEEEAVQEVPISSHTDSEDEKQIHEEIEEEVEANEKEATEESLTEPQEEKAPIVYDPIPHISSKFNHIYNQYPPIEHAVNRYFTVENWLTQIANDGYTEAEIEARIKDADKLKETNLAEAAQLLTVAAATESLYALFRLARALYTGDVLQQNIHESATIIHYLAVNESYPEAICDLAQLHEAGIEVEKNKKKAESLYKEAMNLGIQRAIPHYTRIKQENKNILSRFLS